METSTNIKNSAGGSNNETGNLSRFKQATQKYQLNHQKSQRLKQIDNILENKNENSILVPKPGEFFVVSSAHNDERYQISQREQVAKNFIEGVRNGDSPLKVLPLLSARKSVTRLQETPSKLDRQQSKNSTSTNNLPSVFQSHEPTLTLNEKAREIIEDKNLKTNLTTNIRHIMKAQDSKLLTQSLRLLKSNQPPTLGQEENSTMEGQINSFTSQIFNHAKQHIAVGSKEMRTLFPDQAQSKLNRVQSNKLLPTAIENSQLVKTLKASASVNYLPRAQMPLTQRPASAVLLMESDQQTQQEILKKFDFQGARQRDKSQSQNHSYKVVKINTERSNQFSRQKIQIPELVQRQRQLLREKNNISPFMVNQDRVLQPSPSLPLISTLKTERSTESSFKITQNLIDVTQAKNTDQGRSPFPIEVYDPFYGQENCEELIEKYKDEASGKTFGLSKWNHENTSYEFRQCEVIKYLKDEEMFQIIWQSNGKTKKVGRFNLVFLNEDQQSLQWRIKQAEELRRVGQLILRYVTLCQDTDASWPKNSNQQNKKNLPQLSDNTKTKISYLISCFRPFDLIVKQRVFKQQLLTLQKNAQQRYDIAFKQSWVNVINLEPHQMIVQISETMRKQGFNFSLLSKLFAELDELYIQNHKQFLFDSKLPFSNRAFEDIEEIIPQNKFKTLQERLLNERPVVQVPERSIKFGDLLNHMQNKLHVGNPAKLKILQLSNSHDETVSDQDFLATKFSYPITIDGLSDLNRRASQEIIKLFKNKSFDIEYELQKICNSISQQNFEINKSRRAQLTFNSHEYVDIPIDNDIIQNIKQLQRVLQMRYEQTARKNYISTTERYKLKLRNLISQVNESCCKNLTEVDLAQHEIEIMSRDSILETRIKRSAFFILQTKLRFRDGNIILSPPINEFIETFIEGIKSYEEQMRQLPCYNGDFNLIGSAHANELCHVFQPEEQILDVQKLQIESLLKTVFKVLDGVLRSCKQFSELLKIDLSEFKRLHKKSDFPIEIYQNLLDQGINTKQNAERLFFEPILKLGPFNVNCERLKELVFKKIGDLNSVLFECIKRKIANSNIQIENEVEEVLKIIKHQKVYKDIEHVTETKLYVANLPNKMLQIRQLIKDAMAKMTLLEKYQVSLKPDEMANTWYSISKPLLIFEAQGDCIEILEIFSDRFAVDLKLMCSNLAEEIKDIEYDFDLVTKYESLQLYERAVNKCDQIYDRIDNAISTSQIVNRRERIYNLPVGDYSKIYQLKNSFLPFNSLWNYARDYFYKQSLWMNGPISDLDRDRMPNEITLACKGLLKLAKQDLRVVAGMSVQIANELRNLYLELRPILPIIVALKNPDLQPRHWDIINKIKEGFVVDYDLHQSINDLVRLKVLDILEEIAAVSDIATKEKQLENQLSKMRAEWHTMKFQLQDSYGTVTINGVQPIWDMLDEQIQKTMVIAGSPYVKYLLQDVIFWKQQLVKMQEVLEEWSKAQRGWQYLFPIFNSSDIQTQLEDVTQMFQSVDKMFRVIMLQTQQNPQVMEACNQLKILENLMQCNFTMEKVQKSLNQYLHEKRLLFPRFFFLSNDDLLQILSQTRDPSRVQDHLNKCFEGIYRLKFNEKSGLVVIEGMYSQLDEYVQFNQAVQPQIMKNKQLEVRPVEEWLLEVEKQMRDSLRREMKEASLSFAQLNPIL